MIAWTLRHGGLIKVNTYGLLIKVTICPHLKEKESGSNDPLSVDLQNV